MFRPKQAEVVRSLDFCTSPIDLISQLNQGWNAVVKNFGGGPDPLPVEEIAKLFMVLLAVEPPSNGVALARFVGKWANINLVRGAEEAPARFAAAVEQIHAIQPYKGGEEEDDDEEEEA
jgi:hypothetical protein